ncbi:MAG: hypothetical protein ABIU11_03425, partial [Chitinophagaceae bacterium]
SLNFFQILIQHKLQRILPTIFQYYTLFIFQKFLPSNHPSIKTVRENLALAKDALEKEKNTGKA